MTARGVVTTKSPRTRQIQSWPCVWLCAACCIAFAGGCSGPTLAPTPNLYTQGESTPFGQVPEAFQSSRIEIFYATDRVPIEAEDGTISYGFGRSQSLAVGTCTVTIGEDLSWDELVEASTHSKRQVDVSLAV